jgi:pyruvate dehydrogenase E2 component (dihydrolipoamide acetyltransferase)
MESGTIAAWSVKEGQSFDAGDVLCQVETDKATVDFEAQDEGVVAKILVEAGPADIPCGDPILITVDDEADVAAFADYKVKASAPPPPAATAAPAETDAPPETSATPPPPGATPPTPTPSTPASTSGGRVVASPLAHMLAKDMGYDIASIPGTGPGGRVIAADVKEFVPSAAAAAAAATTEPTVTTTAASTPAPAQAAMAAPTAPPVAGAGYTDYPLSESAKEIAAALTHSKQNVPHYYLTVDISMDALLQMRASLNESLGEDEKLGTYELLLKAAAAAMKAVPSANASWMDSVVRVYDSVDINVVVGNGDALYTPVMKNVGTRGVKSLSKDLNQFVAAVEQESGLGQEFASMGTFTVMNLGMYGIKSCAPIIREPQACALALGAMENRIVPNDDEASEEIYKESVMLTATLSCDHRVVDGAVGAGWLSAFKTHVENPSTLLL